MRQSFILLCLPILLDAPCHGFQVAPPLVRRKPSLRNQQLGSLYEAKEADIILESSNAQTALSMKIEELENVLGGWGRARLAWDCYSNGVDPHYLFSSDTHKPSSALSGNEIVTSEYVDKSVLKEAVIPTPRVTQPLGKLAISLLSDLHSHCFGRVENGLATLVHISTSSDGTTKLLLRLMDGFEVETVLIPFWASGEHKNKDGTSTGSDQSSTVGRATRYASLGRTTVCISSQVGCKQGCSFCATGRMGKLRSLTTDEILVQLFYAKKIVRLSQQYGGDIISGGGQSIVLPPVTNIVFMGMGEPADNAQSVRGAIDIMARNELFQLGANRITVSTVAPTPEAFEEFSDSKCVLAWSVHAVR